MNILEKDQPIVEYLSIVQIGIIMNDDDAYVHREQRARDLVSNLTKAEAHLDAIGQQEAQLLKTAIDELRVQFSLGKMEGVEKLREIENRITHQAKRVSEAFHRAKENASEEIYDLQQGFTLAWRALNTEITLLDLRLDLIKEQARTKVSTATHQVSEDIKLIARLAKAELKQLSENFKEWSAKTKKSVSTRTHKVIDSLEHYLP